MLDFWTAFEHQHITFDHVYSKVHHKTKTFCSPMMLMIHSLLSDGERVNNMVTTTAEEEEKQKQDQEGEEK